MSDNYLIGVTYQNECELNNAICGLSKEFNWWDPMGSKETKLELDYIGQVTSFRLNFKRNLCRNFARLEESV